MSMEDHGILGHGRWSTVRKVQIMAAVTGALLTVMVSVVGRLDLGWDPHGSASYSFFWLFMVVHWPSGAVGELLGISQSASALLWDTLAVGVNAILCFMAGTLIGLTLDATKLGSQ